MLSARFVIAVREDTIEEDAVGEQAFFTHTIATLRKIC